MIVFEANYAKAQLPNLKKKAKGSSEIHLTLSALPIMQNRVSRNDIVLDWDHQNHSWGIRGYKRRVSRACGVRDKNQPVCAAFYSGSLVR